jgi:type III pantothenate kinase
VLLAIDVRNTHTVVGLISGAGSNSTVTQHWRIRTESEVTSDELALTIDGLIGEDTDRVTGAVGLSTVPSVLHELREMLGQYWPAVPHVLIEPGVRTGIPLLVDNPKEVGADRIVNSLAAHHLVDGQPAIVVDFGTATNFDVVNERGDFLGGATAPGIEISLDALAARAAQLRKVELVAPRGPIGKNTVEALQSGILYGFAGQVDGLVRRLSAALHPADPGAVEVIATGGLAALVVEHCDTITRHEPDLTLIGLRLVYERNSDPVAP